MRFVRETKLVVGLVAVFGLFQWIAASLESFRGEYGVAVGIVVVTTTLFAHRLFFGGSYSEAALAIGLFVPKAKGVVIAIIISLVMILTVPVYAYVTATQFSILPNWPWLFAGMFFQAGIAEETLFRGYLYGFFRRRNTFWRAAALSALPFVSVHFLMFFTMDWMIASASVSLAVVTSFPLARLFDLGGNTIWAPAIVHFVVQAGVKLLLADGESAWLYPFFWMIVCAVIPLSVFLVPVKRTHSSTIGEQTGRLS